MGRSRSGLGQAVIQGKPGITWPTIVILVGVATPEGVGTTLGIAPVLQAVLPLLPATVMEGGGHHRYEGSDTSSSVASEAGVWETTPYLSFRTPPPSHIRRRVSMYLL